MFPRSDNLALFRSADSAGLQSCANYYDPAPLSQPKGLKGAVNGLRERRGCVLSEGKALERVYVEVK